MSGENRQEGKPLTLDQLLTLKDRKIQRVDVPEWGKGAHVYIRTMTAAFRDVYDMIITSLEEVDGKPKVLFDRRNIRAWTVALCLCDQDGKAYLEVPRLATKDDEAKVIKIVEQLSERAGAAMDRLYIACMRLNRLRDQDLEELVKN